MDTIQPSFIGVAMRFSAITYFDKKYINRGLALVNSVLAKNSDLEVFYIQTLDLESYNEVKSYFLRNSRVLTFAPDVIKDDIEEMAKFLNGNELFFALKPVCIQKCIDTISFKGHLIYLDADLYFFRELQLPKIKQDYSVLLSEHVFANRTRNHIVHGKHNAGFIIFQLTKDESRDFLKLWLKMCLDTAMTPRVSNSFSDQLILEEVSRKFSTVDSISDIRINQSLWAIDSMFSISSRKRIIFMLRELIAFHFHGLQETDSGINTGIRRYGRTNVKNVSIIRYIYLLYIREIEQIRIDRGLAQSFMPKWKILLSLFVFGKVKWRE